MAFYRTTLLLVLAIAHFAPVAIPGVNALQGMHVPPARRAEHNDMNARMIKKRAPAHAKRQNTDTANQSPTANPTGPTTTAPPQTSSSTTRGGGLISSILNDITSRSSATSSSSSTSATSSASSSTEASSETSRRSATSRNSTVRTAVVTETAASASQSDASQDPDASFLPKPVIIGLIVTAASLAVGAAIWTVIRKWKFSPSRQFEDRLEPVNWEPTQSSGLPHDPTVAALARGAGSVNGHRQHGSFGSSDDHHSTRNMTNINDKPATMAPDFPPAHDFTAGSTTGGYADMYRGPSPNPGYGQYEQPNPYDAYDYNAGYGQRRY